MAEQDLHGRGEAKKSVSDLLSTSAPKKQEPKASESWKKDSQGKRPKVTYKTAAEVAASATSGEQGFRILDMRGPEVRVATSFSELAASISADSVKSLKELRHNTRLLVSKYEDRIRSIAEKKKFYQDTLIAAERDREQLTAVSSLGSKEMDNCRDMVKEIESFRERQDKGTISLSELGVAFSKMRKERPDEFKAIRAFDVAVALAVPVAKNELASWKPLVNPEEGVKPLRSWKKLAEGESLRAINVLCESALLPRLRFALCDWSPRDFDPCIRLLEVCREGLPPEATEEVIAQVVLPRLRSEVESWDPRADHMPIHIWIHPWLPILGSRLEPLFTPIRFRLSACLERWDPHDHSALSTLKPWRKVFDVVNWEPLVEKVLSRLERGISSMRVQPDGQDLEPIKDLIIWIDVMPLAGLAQVLESALFPRWQKALRVWLRTPGCDYGEVIQWYQGWRALIPEVLREQANVQKQLAQGLQLMKHAMSQGEEGAGEVDDESPEAAAPPPDAPEAKRQESKEDGASANPEDISLSLSDYLSEVAGENSMVFRPKGRTNSRGQQIYQFGAASICLEKNMVYVAAGGDDWRLVTFDELMQLAKRNSAKKKA